MMTSLQRQKYYCAWRLGNYFTNFKAFQFFLSLSAHTPHSALNDALLFQRKQSTWWLGSVSTATMRRVKKSGICSATPTSTKSRSVQNYSCCTIYSSLCSDLEIAGFLLRLVEVLSSFWTTGTFRPISGFDTSAMNAYTVRWPSSRSVLCGTVSMEDTTSCSSLQASSSQQEDTCVSMLIHFVVIWEISLC